MENEDERREFSPEPKHDPLAIASLVVGSVAIVMGCCCLYLNTPISIIGVVLGVLAMIRIRDDDTLRGREVAIAGIVLSSLGVLVWVVMLAIGLGSQALR